MDIRHYRSFIALAEARSFTAAARRLNIVQSGLSVTIKEMEQELGVALVNRTTRRVSLTDAGVLFLEYARSGLTLLGDGIQAVRSQSHVVRGRLSLGILQSLAPYIDLPALLTRFHAEYPAVEFAVRAVDSTQAPELVRSNFVDVSFHAATSTKAPAGVDVIPFAQDSLVAICASTHPLSQRTTVTLETLIQEPFVDLSPERALRTLIDKSLIDHNLRRKSMYEVSSVETMMQFVAGGLGVSIVPAALARASATNLRLRVLPFRDQTFRMPKWRLVILARPLRRKLPGKTLQELFLEALTAAARLSSGRGQIRV